MFFLLIPHKCAITGAIVHRRYRSPMVSEKTAQKAVKRFPGAYVTDEHNRMMYQNIIPSMPVGIGA